MIDPDSTYQTRLLDEVNDAIIAFDMRAVITSWNRGASKIYGWTAAEMIGRPGLEFFGTQIKTQDSSSHERQMIMRNLHQSGSWRGEMIHYRKNSSFVHIESNALTLQDAEGNLTGYITINRDITARKLAEDILKKNEARLKSLFENLPAGVVVIKGNALTFNKAAEAIIGYQRYEIPTLEDWFVTLHGENAAAIRMQYEQDRTAGLPGSRMVNLTTKNGQVRWVDIATFKDEQDEVWLLVDRTDQRLAVEALREREQSLSALVENAHSGILIATSTGQHVFANKQAAEITGYSRAELQALNMRQLAHPDEISKLTERLSQRLAGKEVPKQYEARILHKDGTIRIIEVTGAPAIWHGQLCDIVIINDVTERKRADDALRASMELVRSISNNLTSGMIYQLLRLPDGSRKFTYVSETVQLFYGICSQEAMADANLIYSRVHPDDRMRVWQEEEEANRALSIFRTEVRMIAPTGEIRWSSFVSTPHQLNDGVTCWDGIEFDITERKHAEASLRQSESQLKTVTDHAPDTILHVNWDGIILFVNRPMPGLTREQIIGSSVYAWVPQENHPILARTLEAVFTTGVRQEYESLGPGPYGEVRVYSVRVMPVLIDGKADTAIYIATDVTERKRAEEALLESAQQLRELNATKDTLLSIIAHDLYNPLSVVIGYCELLINSPAQFSPGDYQNTLVQINNSAIQFQHVLENLLLWTRSQTGRLACTLEKINLLLEVDVCLSLLRPSAQKKEITLEHHIPAELQAYADQNMLAIVIRNLIANAIKFTHEGGHILITAAVIDHEIQFCVKDNGVGIEPQQLATLFNVIEYKSKKGTWQESGTGLGLVLCKEFVERNKGRIWVESKPGDGSIFTFTIPKAGNPTDVNN